MKPLAPLRVPWVMKPLASAQTSVTTLPDGRLKFAITHDVLRGVTPAMLVWWFNNMHGEHDVGFGLRLATGCGTRPIASRSPTCGPRQMELASVPVRRCVFRNSSARGPSSRST